MWKWLRGRVIFRRRGHEPWQDISQWHAVDTFWPVRTLEDKRETRVWRRWRVDRWEYTERPYTYEEWLERQW